MKLFGLVITRQEHAPASILDRLERVENTLARVTKDLKELSVDWESVLDKIARYTARQAARSRRAISEAVDSPEAPPPSHPAPLGEGDGAPITQKTPKSQLRAMLASGQLRKLSG